MKILPEAIEKIDVKSAYLSMATPNGDFLSVQLVEENNRFAIIDIRDNKEVIDQRVLTLIKAENAIRMQNLNKEGFTRKERQKRIEIIPKSDSRYKFLQNGGNGVQSIRNCPGCLQHTAEERSEDLYYCTNCYYAWRTISSLRIQYRH